MQQLKVPVAQALAHHVAYATRFADPRIAGVTLQADHLVVDVPDDAEAIKDIRTKIERLVTRFAQSPVFESRTVFTTGTPGNVRDVYPELVATRQVVPTGQGQVTLRELPFDLLQFFDDTFVRTVAKPAQARGEYYPSVMASETLALTNHFSSFPEHIHFVTHLVEDLDVLDNFTAQLRKGGGLTPEILANVRTLSSPPAIVINPTVCYHCYAARANTSVEGEGLVVTAKSRCHRYESGNHKTLARLLDFTMREVIFVGTPSFVKDARAAATDRIQALVERWGLHSWLETANDPFFTNDFAVKASFQRRNDMKLELIMPLAEGRVAVASSNFHSTTFGQAFHITCKTRPACTGCIGFGLERWVYAVLSQVGLDMAKWPHGLQSDFAAWRERG